MALSLVDLERSAIRLETERRVLIRTNEELHVCSLQSTSSSGLITDMLLNNIPPVYLGSAFNVDKAILKCRSREDFELVPFNLELRINRKKRTEEMEEMGIRREDKTIVALSIPLLECNMYTQYTPSIGHAD